MDILEFAEVVGVELWPVQRVALKLLYGMALKPVSFPVTFLEVSPGSINQQVTHMTEISYAHMLKEQGRLHVPGGEGPWHLYLVAGRRAGKSKLAALITLYETYRTLNMDFEKEGYGKSTCLSHILVGPTRALAEIVFADMMGMRARMPSSDRPIMSHTRNNVQWGKSEDTGTGYVHLTVKTALAKGLRGYASRVVTLDGYSSFSKSSAGEVLMALEPSLRAHGGNLIITGTPVMNGNTEFPERFKAAMGSEDTVVVRIPTWEMNPEWGIEPHMADMSVVQFLTEYGAEFFESQTLYVPEGVTAFTGSLQDLS